MDYEKKLALAKEALDSGSYDKETIEYIFPELAESEDEKIRKELLEFLDELSKLGKNTNFDRWSKSDCADWIIWLEKQGETYTKKDVDNAYLEGMAFAKDELEKQNKQILANSAKTCKDEQKPTDNDMKEALRTEYEKGRADAIAEIEMQKLVDCIDCTNSKGCINCKDGNMKETLVRKTAWSKEDEEELDIAISTLKEAGQHDSAKWLKFLKDRVQPKQEWSEEDIRNIEDIDSILFYNKDLPEDTCMRLRNWLKSLRPQSQWKPSDEQMIILQEAIGIVGQLTPRGECLKELVEQLKKLKGY